MTEHPIPPRQARGPIRQAVDALAAAPKGASIFVPCDAVGVAPHVLSQRVGNAIYKARQTTGWAVRRIVCEYGVDGVRLYKVSPDVFADERRPRAPWTARTGAQRRTPLVEHLAKRLCVPTQTARLAAALLDGPVSSETAGLELCGSVGNLRTAAARLRQGIYYTSSKALNESVRCVSHYDLTPAARDLLEALRDEIRPKPAQSAEIQPKETEQ